MLRSSVQYLRKGVSYLSSGDYFQQLPSETTSSKPIDNIFQELVDTLAEYEMQFKLHLKACLDDKTYENYFEKAYRDKQTGIYELDKDGDEKIIFYKKSINLIIHAKLFLARYKLVDDFIMQNKHNISTTGWPILLAAALQNQERFKACAEAYTSLRTSITSLELSNFLMRFSSLEKIQANAYNVIMPYAKKLFKGSIQNNPFLLAIGKKIPEWDKIIATANDRATALRELMTDLTNLPTSEHERQFIRDTISTSDDIYKHLQKFFQSKQNLPDVLWLVGKIYYKVTFLSQNINQINAHLGVAFHEHTLKTIYNINEVLKNLVLIINLLETEYYFKKGFLLHYEIIKGPPKIKNGVPVLINGVPKLKKGVSIHSIIESFHAKVLQYQYKFDSKNTYPYTAALSEQRISLLAQLNPTDKTSKAQRELLARHILDDEQLTTFPNKKDYIAEQHQAENEAAEVKKSINSLIDKRISSLKKNAASIWFFSKKTNLLKTSLLMKLKNELQRTTSLHEALEEVASQLKQKKHQITLLWEGETGNVLRDIQSKCHTIEERMACLDHEIVNLTRQRESRFYFFAQKRRTNIENNIRALNLLKITLNKTGYRLHDALRELHANRQPIYHLLITQQPTLIATMQAIDQGIPNRFIGKKIIDFDTTTINPEEKINNTYLCTQIEQQIALLKREIALQQNSFLPHTQTKKNKLSLLHKLNTLLLSHRLETALDLIATDKEYCQLYYLLHEGRTGLLLNKLTLSQTTTFDRQKMLATAIAALRRKSEISPAFFSFREKSIEDRKFVLIKIKKHLDRHENDSIYDALALLTAEEKGMIEKVESVLLQELKRQDAAIKQTVGIRKA